MEWLLLRQYSSPWRVATQPVCGVGFRFEVLEFMEYNIRYWSQTLESVPVS